MEEKLVFSFNGTLIYSKYNKNKNFLTLLLVFATHSPKKISKFITGNRFLDKWERGEKEREIDENMMHFNKNKYDYRPIPLEIKNKR